MATKKDQKFFSTVLELAYLEVGNRGTLVFRIVGIGGDGEITTLGKILLALLLAELDIEFVAVASQLLGLEGSLGLEVLGSVFGDGHDGIG